MKQQQKEFEQCIFDVFVERGIANEDWRIKVTDREIIGNSDYARVLVEVYKPRHRKPETTWDLCFNFVRNQIHWDQSNFSKN